MYYFTGSPGWGIAWYVNSQIIPEITVQRNRKYTFTVHGGNDPEISANYHPFYITNDAVGGYAQKTPEERVVSSQPKKPTHFGLYSPKLTLFLD